MTLCVNLSFEAADWPRLALGEPAAERTTFGEVELIGRLPTAILRVDPAIPESHTLAAMSDAMLPNLRSSEWGVAANFASIEAEA